MEKCGEGDKSRKPCKIGLILDPQGVSPLKISHERSLGRSDEVCTICMYIFHFFLSFLPCNFCKYSSATSWGLRGGGLMAKWANAKAT